MRAKRTSEINVMIGMEPKKYGIAEVRLKEEFTFNLKDGEPFTPNHLVCYEDEKGNSHISVVGNEIIREVGKSYFCVNYNKLTTPQKMRIVAALDLNTVMHHNVRRPATFKMK